MKIGKIGLFKIVLVLIVCLTYSCTVEETAIFEEQKSIGQNRIEIKVASTLESASMDGAIRLFAGEM